MNQNKLIITTFQQKYLPGILFLDDKPVRILDFTNDSPVGNIYCGYVNDVVKNIHAAFVSFGDDEKGYLSLRDEDCKAMIAISQTGEIKNNAHLCQGDKVLVQVSGDKIKGKDYSLTTKISFSSSCLVLTVGNNDISISRKISDSAIRNQLKEMFQELKNDEFGWILRTNITNFSKEEVLKQANSLIEKWKKIKSSFLHASYKAKLYCDDKTLRNCRECHEKFGAKIITDNQEIYDRLKEENLDLSLNIEDKISLSNKYSLDKHLREALQKKVWLKSGAYLVIEPTEALTSIDVNTGKANMHSNREETIRKVNIEAAKELVRQIQLRNLSGIIIVDFINMKNQQDYQNLIEIMRDLVRNDFVPCYVMDFTKLGLLEISRKKQEKPLHEIITL